MVVLKVANSTNSLAAVFIDSKQPLDLRQIAKPNVLSAPELLVRVTCCTLCGSDLSTLAGHRHEPTPCILGHEIVGIVESLGSDHLKDLRGETISPGDRIVWAVAASCDSCRNCVRGIPQKCTHLKKYGHQQLSPAWQLSGGFAQHCHLVSGTKAIVLKNDQPDEVFAPASCATATVAAALRTAVASNATRLQGARVLVLGAGLLGLTAAAMAKSRGADSVTVCDVSASRLELAPQFGADTTIAWDEFCGALQPIYDVVLEMSGNAEAVQASLDAAATGASIVLVGSVRPTPAIEISPEHVIRRLLSIHGVHNYTPDDLIAAVEFLESHGASFPFAEVVSVSFPLQDINVAIEYSRTTPAIRIAIKP